MGQYIPDLTERFPEGYGGVDMTPAYFGEPVDWSRAYREDDYDDYEDYCEAISCEEIPTEPLKFEVGDEYDVVGIYGGITIYRVEEIDRENKKILLSEIWIDVDGEGKRPSEWHELAEDEEGNERALEWSSKTYGDFWIYAKKGD